MTKVVASIEARMSSSRLPGKIMENIGGKPMLARIVDRLSASEVLDGIVVATTTSQEDDVTEEWAKTSGVEVFRGSEEDVLARVVAAQQFMGAEVVVEVCGDCPFIDPTIVDLAVETFFANRCDIVTTTQYSSFPQGLDVQVFRLSALEEIQRSVIDPAVREHVSLQFYEDPGYRRINLVAPKEQAGHTIRCQVDYPEDLDFVRRVYGLLAKSSEGIFGAKEIVELIQRMPTLADINRNCEERPVRENLVVK